MCSGVGNFEDGVAHLSGSERKCYCLSWLLQSCPQVVHKFSTAPADLYYVLLLLLKTPKSLEIDLVWSW